RTLLPEPVVDTGSLFAAAKALLRQFPPDGRGVRLTGVSVTHLEEGLKVLALFPDVRAEKGREVEQLISRIEDRLGVRLTRAALASHPACRPAATPGTRRSKSRR